MSISSRQVPRLLIQHCRDEQCLVSFSREAISEHSSQGYIIDFDANWVLIQLIYDFQTDGFLLVRISDLTQLKYDGTETFQHKLIKIDGELEQVAFEAKLPVLKNGGKNDAGLAQFLRELPKGKVVILEDELDEDSFDIGFIEGVKENEILFKYFDGEAIIDPEPYEIFIEEVTSVRLDSRYTLAYERHFARSGLDKNKG